MGSATVRRMVVGGVFGVLSPVVLGQVDQWVVDQLEAPGASYWLAGGVGAGGVASGIAVFDGLGHAAVWGPNGAFVDLHPAGATSSIARATDGVQQVGSATVDGVVRAVLWTGDPSGWVDLHPGVAYGSAAWDVRGGVQVGAMNSGNLARAALWRGDAASFVNLHPAGASYSVAFATDGAVQGGYASYGTTWKAGVWAGSAESFVLLAPAGARESVVWALADGEQGGYVTFGQGVRASIWHGSAASYVDLHPAGAADSQVRGIAAGRQAGFVTDQSRRNHAYVWSGTAGSGYNLGAAAWPAFSESMASRAWSDGVRLYVSGYVGNEAAGTGRGVVWSMRIVPCLADVNGDGFVDFFDYDDYVACFETGSCPEGRTGDFNGDGFVDFFDYGDFVRAFEEGC